MTVIAKEKLETLNHFLLDSDKIVIVSHTHPDGDALGSGSAMLSFLKEKRKKAEVNFIIPNSFAANLEFIPGERLSAEENPEKAESLINGANLILILDMNKLSRAEGLEKVIRNASGKKVLIDHHLDPEVQDFDLVFSIQEISSTCEHLYHILSGLPDISGDASRLPSDCRTALLTGMTTDTNNFANSVFPSTLRMASELMAAGTDRDHIIQQLYFRYKESRIRAFAHFLKDNLVIMDGKFAYIILDRQSQAQFQLGEGDTEGLVNIPLSIDGVCVSALLKEDKDYFRVSLRSKKGICLTGFAGRFFHGGGHAQASGGRVYFPEDIPAPGNIKAYLEDAAAQFMKEISPQK